MRPIPRPSVSKVDNGSRPKRVASLFSTITPAVSVRLPRVDHKGEIQETLAAGRI
jgi:hypothetical protein